MIVSVDMLDSYYVFIPRASTGTTSTASWSIPRDIVEPPVPALYRPDFQPQLTGLSSEAGAPY
jgi:hypothetical protein